MKRFALSAVLVCAGPGLMASERPNILFIAVDDLNSWTGATGGHPQARTPHLDMLAAQGVNCTRAFCQAPVCNPSRTSVLTGLRPTTSGIYALDPWFRASATLAARTTLPQAFAAAGWHTAQVGKVYHGGGTAAPGAKPEFTEGLGLRPTGKPRLRHSATATSAKGLVGQAQDWGPKDDLTDNDLNDVRVADRVVEFIAAQPADRPWFLAMGFSFPHLPMTAPPSWFADRPLDQVQLPQVPADPRAGVPAAAWLLNWKLPEPDLAWLSAHDQWRSLVQAYLATTTGMDAQLGRVLAALDASGQRGNTLIALWGDNGYHLGEKGVSAKCTLWDESARVPMVLAGPGIPAGVQIRQPVELLDLYPTLTALAGVSAPPDLQGMDLRPLFASPGAPRPPAITSQGPHHHAVRTAQWTGIRYADGSREMYDAVNDPHELHNLAGDPTHSAVWSDLERLLPAHPAPPVPGSIQRLADWRDGQAYWEGVPVPEAMWRQRR